MGIDIKFWRNRVTSRIDLTTSIVHLTRPSDDGTKTAMDNLFKILIKRKIYGSTNSGFIVGDKPAVCFQDAPLISLAQNIDHEKKIRLASKISKIRYSPLGLMFSKPYVFRKGGRPVFYERTSVAKKILPPEEHWRIVKFDLSEDENIVDWTHEREWRVSGNFEFDLDEAAVIVGNDTQFRNFQKRCERVEEEDDEPNFLKSVKYVIPLSNLLL